MKRPPLVGKVARATGAAPLRDLSRRIDRLAVDIGEQRALSQKLPETLAHYEEILGRLAAVSRFSEPDTGTQTGSPTGVPTGPESTHDPAS